MNAVQLKKRAENLTKRLNALGFTKGGKPMVVDQAFELVAAAAGFRNQHALRASLGLNPTQYVGIPVDIDEEFAKAVLVQHTMDEDDFNHAYEAWGFIVEEAKKRGFLLVEPEEHSAADVSQAHADWASIIRKQGWNDESQLTHAMGFIAERGLMLDFVAYVQAAADQENDLAEDSTTSCEVLSSWGFDDGILAQLGYTVAFSDYRKPFWQVGEKASEDYSSVTEAWEGAWRHAQRTTRRMVGLTEKDFNRLPEPNRKKLLREYSYLVLEARKAILEHNGYIFNEDADQGILFTWRFQSEGSTVPLSSMEVAVQAAWTHLIHFTGLPAEVLAVTPLEAQRFVIEGALGGQAQKSEMVSAVEGLEARWGHAHGYYTRQDWQNDVSKGDTKLGYWEWVQHNIESWESESDNHYHCSDCGCRAGDDGEGEDGRCGSCADKFFNLNEVKNRESSHRKAAEEAFSDYDFGDEYFVTDFDGWGFVSPDYDHWSRTVFLQLKNDLQAASITKKFEVWVTAGAVTEVKVS